MGRVAIAELQGVQVTSQALSRTPPVFRAADERDPLATRVDQVVDRQLCSVVSLSRPTMLSPGGWTRAMLTYGWLLAKSVRL